MSSQIGVFERTEKKYGLSAERYKVFLDQVKDKIKIDQFGAYTIRNIYYDTGNYDLIRHSIEKPNYKEKFRIRGYGDICDRSLVYMELKKKVNGIVYKRRTSMTCIQAKRYIDTRILPDRHDQVLREIDYFLDYYQPMPRLYLTYDRVAYTGWDEPELRITFDQNIISRGYDLDLTKGDYGALLREPDYLMEIKAVGAYPVWLANTLSELQIFPISFSKYGMIYKEHIVKTTMNHQVTAGKEEGRCLQAHLAV